MTEYPDIEVRQDKYDEETCVQKWTNNLSSSHNKAKEYINLMNVHPDRFQDIQEFEPSTSRWGKNEANFDYPLEDVKKIQEQ